MPYCPKCGTEHPPADTYCSNCGEELSESETKGSEEQAPNKSEWNWLDPRGPFRSPRNILNTINTVGVVIIIVGIVLAVSGVDSPYAFLPSPLDILLLVYMLGVIFIGLPLWFILLLTDNVLGFLRKG